MMIRTRMEQAEDILAIREANTRAFGLTQEADLIDTLRHNCGNLLSLVATLENRVVGHILFSPAIIEGDDRIIHGMGLAPMAVLPEYQRQGIGSALIRTGIELLSSRSCPFVIVLGHAEYYPRFGFVNASSLGIRSEWEVPDDAFMILVLNASEIQGTPCMARYRPEFGDAI